MKEVERVIELEGTDCKFRARMLRHSVDSDALVSFKAEDFHGSDLTLYHAGDDENSRMLLSCDEEVPIELVAFALRAAGYEVTLAKPVTTDGDALRALGVPEWAAEHDAHPRERREDEDEADEDAGGRDAHGEEE